MKQRKTRSKRNVSGDCKKGKSIFACETTQKEVSSEATKTDCMNHGYRIIRTLGEGAYAKVKLAEVSASRLARNEEMSIKSEFTDGELQVAIKVISKTAIPKEFLLKFLPREVENHSRLPDHPHVVRVFDHFSTHGHVYLVMEYCKNGDLLDLINNHIGTNQKGIGEELSRKLFRQICEGLLHIHSNNIVHRDLKCENVLLDENMDAKLTDFGFSATVEDPKAMLRTSCGSYAYTAPEVIRNKPYEGFKADIWSLGIMLFAMINGRLPFNDAQILDMEEDMKMQRLRFERSATFDCMVLIRKLLQYHPLERPCLDDIINDPWLCGKKPIPRQVQRAKINPYPGRKPGEKEVSTIVHTPTEVIELPASMRNNTICYRQDLSPRAYNDSLTGTVTVKQKDGETVTLKSRTGRSFGKKIEVPAVCNRPATWPRSKTGSPELKKPTNKPRTQTQYQHTGADIRNVARLIVDKYKQGETIPSNSKEVPKQVPLWLLNQVLNSEGVQTDHEKIALLGKQVPAHSPYCSPSETPNQESRPSTGCPACAIKSMSTPSGSEKENQHNPANNQKKSKTTLRKSANGSYMSSTPSVGDIPPSPTPYDCQSPTLRKQRIGYTSPIPIKKTEERNSMRASDPQYCYEKELVPQVSGLRLGPERSTSTRATKVSSGFKFKVMTPASRAHMCRERKMQAYTNQAFHQAIWPLPLVHGTNLPMNRSPPKPRPTPRDKNPNANPRDSKPTAKSEDDSRCMTIGGTVKPRHTLVVHVAS